jgi:hypothetical protein
MDLLQTVLNAQGGGAVDELARNFGLDRNQAQSAVATLLPALAGGLKREATSQGGLDGLLGALAQGNHQRYLENPSALTAPETIQDGNGILGHILGSKDVSRRVAADASAKTGIGADVLKRMLPMVAALAMGALSKGTAGGHAQLGQGGGLLSMLAPLLDRDKDGSIVDDLGGMLGRFRT